MSAPFEEAQRLAWRHFVQTLPQQGPWRGMYTERTAPLDPKVMRGRRRVPDLETRLEANRELLEVAIPHLQWLDVQLREVPHAICLVDSDGVSLFATGNPVTTLEDGGFVPGFEWSERAMGVNSNSPGRALALGQPVAYIAPEDFFPPERGCVCTSAPLSAPDGSIIGAIDAMTSIRAGNPWRLITVSHIAQVISEQLACRREAQRTNSVKLLVQLSSFLAHELANPLAALIATLDMVPTGHLDAQAADRIVRCRAIAHDMAEVSESLRALGGDSHHRLRPVALDHFLAELRAMINLPASHSFTLETDTRALPSHLPMHRRLLLQALNNLIRNAAEAMPQGGELGLRVGARVGGVRLTVWDRGVGIPPAQQARLFQASFTTKKDGSGLGLLLVKAIVEGVHGGRLSFSPNLPSGAQFHVDLPVGTARREQVS